MSLGEMIIQMQMKSYDLNKKLYWLNIIGGKCSIHNIELLKMPVGNTLCCLVSGLGSNGEM